MISHDKRLFQGRSRYDARHALLLNFERVPEHGVAVNVLAPGRVDDHGIMLNSQCHI